MVVPSVLGESAIKSNSNPTGSSHHCLPTSASDPGSLFLLDSSEDKENNCQKEAVSKVTVDSDEDSDHDPNEILWDWEEAELEEKRKKEALLAERTAWVTPLKGETHYSKEESQEGQGQGQDKVMGQDQEGGPRRRLSRVAFASSSSSTTVPVNNLSGPAIRMSSNATSGTQSKVAPRVPPIRPMALSDYLKAELTRGYHLEHDVERLSARREKVYTFIKVPGELERLMAYGFFQCADAFLFVFTFLPLRCLIATFNIIIKLAQLVIRWKYLSYTNIRNSIKPADKCDLLKFFVLVVCVYIFSFIDTSVIYHVIKSQSVIKLYIFFNMLEVGDRLFASFVQDTLDALFLTAIERSERKSRWGIIIHTSLSIFSVLCYAVVILLQGTTLSVAINANNRALLTVMMSNNFVELKGAVFKKFDKHNLFQVACSDVRERFHLAVLLLIVSIQTMREYSWQESRFWILFPDCVMVLLAEVGVDWIKHAFISRFNEIHPDTYKEYTMSLAYDLAQTKQHRAFADHSDMVGRRLGFVPLPLAVVLIRVISPSLKGLTPSTCVLCVIGYLGLISFRLLNSIILLGKACDLIDSHQRKQQQVAETIAEPSSAPSQHPVKSESDLSLPNGILLNPRGPSASSHPNTRTPSPSRGIESLKNGPSERNNSSPELDDEDRFDRTLLPSSAFSSPLGYQSIPSSTKIRSRKKDSTNGTKMYRSYSASHTPRSSLTGVNLVNDENRPLMTDTAPDLPDANSTLLMANSAVSLLSVSLNEEMLRANVCTCGASGRGALAPKKSENK